MFISRTLDISFSFRQCITLINIGKWISSIVDYSSINPEGIDTGV